MDQSPSSDSPTLDTAQAHTLVMDLELQIKNAIVGQHNMVREIIVALLAAGHVLIEGRPGLGKTLLVRSLAQAVGGGR